MTRPALLAAALLTALVVAHVRRAQAQARAEAVDKAMQAAAWEPYALRVHPSFSEWERQMA